MGIAWLLIVLYLVLITPVQGGVVFFAGEGRQGGAAGVLIWGIALQRQFQLTRDGEGRLRLESGPKGKSQKPERDAPKKARKYIRILRALVRGDHARRLLKKALHISVLEGSVGVGTENAAHTALLCAALQGISSLLPQARLHVWPRFNGKSTLRLRCIVSARLGILLAACLLGAISYLLSGKKEEKAWNIPSDA